MEHTAWHSVSPFRCIPLFLLAEQPLTQMEFVRGEMGTRRRTHVNRCLHACLVPAALQDDIESVLLTLLSQDEVGRRLGGLEPSRRRLWSRRPREDEACVREAFLDAKVHSFLGTAIFVFIPFVIISFCAEHTDMSTITKFVAPCADATAHARSPTAPAPSTRTL